MGFILNERKKRRKGKKKVILFILVSFIIIGIIGIVGYKLLKQPQSQSSLSNLNSNTLNVFEEATINPYKSNPELDYFSVTLDNGLKISYKGYAITYRPQFILKSGNVLSWQDITNNFPTIQKEVWVNQISGNKKEWGVNFNNLTLNQINAIDSIRLHLVNATKTVNGTIVKMIWSDVNKYIKKENGQLKIAGKINLNKDFFNHLNIIGVNKTDITISGFDNEWVVCDIYNSTFDCIASHNETHWKYNPSLNTYNISIY